MHTQRSSILAFEYSGLRKIISGGQVGADAGALDGARENGLPTGGWAPRGWRTGAGPRPELAEFGLIEHFRPEYKYRTEKNIEESDGTLIIASDLNSPGSALTVSTCSRLGKPFYCARPSNAREKVSLIVTWLQEYDIEILNVAGNRDKGSSTIHHDAAKETVIAIIQALRASNEQ